MLVRERHARIYERALRQLRPGFLGCALEGEDGEGSVCGVVGYGGVVDVAGGVVDGGYDEVADGGDVLELFGFSSGYCVGSRGRGTRPLMCSTQIAFLRASVNSWPDTVGEMVLGGMRRRPGPSLSATSGRLVRRSGSRWSPGRTKASVAMLRQRS